MKKPPPHHPSNIYRVRKLPLSHDCCCFIWHVSQFLLRFMAAVAILRNVLLMILTQGDLQRVILATINDKSLDRVQELKTQIRMCLASSVSWKQERPQNTCGAARLESTDWTSNGERVKCGCGNTLFLQLVTHWWLVIFCLPSLKTCWKTKL